jgi:nucleotide sugar dehydrogenase
MKKVTVVGLGKVGSAVARLCAEHGYDVNCVDVDSSIVAAVNDGTYFTESVQGHVTASTDSSDFVNDSEVILITVPTPLDSAYTVDLSALEAACRNLGRHFDPSGQPPLIVIESTVPPGTARRVVEPIFADAGLEQGVDFYLASAPERIDPGNDSWPLETIPRVVAGFSEEGTAAVTSFYEDLLDADVHPVDEPEVAESSKIIENAFRDINIAFVNEITKSLSELGIDAIEALDAAATKPFGFMRFSPGAGVGGDCIPVDPYLLIERAERSGFNPRFLKLARRVNDSMPEYVAEQTIKSLNDAGILPQSSRVLLLGRSFKPGVADDRNSPYFDIRAKLEEYDVTVETYDPFFEEESTVDSPYEPVDAVVLVTGHDVFRDLDWGRIAAENVDIVVDGRNALDKDAVTSQGIEYVGIGRS